MNSPIACFMPFFPRFGHHTRLIANAKLAAFRWLQKPCMEPPDDMAKPEKPLFAALPFSRPRR